MTLINEANDEKVDPGTPNVLIPKTEAERDAMLAGAKPLDPALAKMRERSAPLTALLSDWGFRPIMSDEHPAMVNLLRGTEFGNPVSEVKPILMHKVRYNDESTEATVTQPHVLSLVTSLATNQSAIIYGYLAAVEPVTIPALDARGLTSFDPETGHPLREVKRNANGRVVYNYEWHAVAVRAVTDEDREDDGLFSLISLIGEEFADLLVDPVDEVPETPVVKAGLIDYSKVKF